MIRVESLIQPSEASSKQLYQQLILLQKQFSPLQNKPDSKMLIIDSDKYALVLKKKKATPIDQREQMTALIVKNPKTTQSEFLTSFCAEPEGLIYLNWPAEHFYVNNIQTEPSSGIQFKEKYNTGLSSYLVPWFQAMADTKQLISPPCLYFFSTQTSHPSTFFQP